MNEIIETLERWHRDASVDGMVDTFYSDVVKHIKELESRLKEAEEVIGFYADPESWMVKKRNGWIQRAREYQKKHQGKEG